jgi:hypothetical protein
LMTGASGHAQGSSRSDERFAGNSRAAPIDPVQEQLAGRTIAGTLKGPRI